MRPPCTIRMRPGCSTAYRRFGSPGAWTTSTGLWSPRTTTASLSVAVPAAHAAVTAVADTSVTRASTTPRTVVSGYRSEPIVYAPPRREDHRRRGGAGRVDDRRGAAQRARPDGDRHRA